jgi:hypothetical protein
MAVMSQTKSMADGKTAENVKEIEQALNGDATGKDVSFTGDVECKSAVTVKTGQVVKLNLPTSDPGVTGQLWSNSGVVTVS